MPLSPLDASPLLIFSLLGIWGIIFLIRNYFGPNPFYTIRTFRFYKAHAPRWFLAFTLFYLLVAGVFAVGPACLVWSLRTTR